MARPNLFTIAPHAPFLPTLVEAIADKRLPCPDESAFGLSDLTILVPTRRARLALSDALLDTFGSALLLPDIRALGDTDAAELPFLPPYDKGALPTPVSSTERRLRLAELVSHWVELEDRTAFNVSGFASPPSAGEILALSDSLGTLIDACHTEGVDVSAFRALATEKDLSVHWQRSLEFLDIALTAWPNLIDAHRADAARVRDLALARLTEAVPALFGNRPVIAAGSTGSVPATARLLSAIARLPNGAVVLPGLDTGMTDETRAALARFDETPHSHPQYGLVRLLDRLNVGTGEVEELASAPHERTEIVRNAMSLAPETSEWSARHPGDEAALSAFAKLSILAARNEDEEARAIAVCARQSLETGRSVGIVTPDRNLARRIAVELKRFEIAVDDAAGTPLHQSRAGRLMRAAMSVVSENWSPVPLVALLRNRNVTLGMPRPALVRLVDQLELATLRGQRPAQGADGIRAAVAANLADRLNRPALRLTEDQGKALSHLVDLLETALAPISALLTSPFTATSLADALAESFSRLTGAGSENAARPEGGDELLRWAETMRLHQGLGPQFRPVHCAEAFYGLVAGLSVRARSPDTIGVSLLGLLEARLLTFDTAILAGLNEGVWPAAADPGPWLSRTMAIALGLEPEDRRQGQAAHDFEMALGNDEVVLAYAERIGTAPALPSRLLQRLETFAGAATGEVSRARGATYVASARALDAVAEVVPAQRPAPCPPAHIRPRRLSITEIEKLLRSPYDLYARHVLKLGRLDPLGMDADRAERGTMIHDVLAAVIASGIDFLAPDALDHLLAHADSIFAGLETQPARRAIWRRRLMMQGARFLEFEAAREPQIAKRNVEIDGHWTFEVAGERFELRGRADRVDQRVDGAYEILDFKTGSVPSVKDMRLLLAPQLLAEAKMASEGAFKDLPPAPVAALTYLKLPADPNGFEKIDFATADDRPLADAAEDMHRALQTRIEALLIRDDLPMLPDILPNPKQMFAGDFEHLSRRAEWAAVDDGEGDE